MARIIDAIDAVASTIVYWNMDDGSPDVRIKSRQFGGRKPTTKDPTAGISELCHHSSYIHHGGNKCLESHSPATDKSQFLSWGR